MIERYGRPEMAEVWSDARRLALWLDVELAMTAAREARGDVPAGTCERIRGRVRLDLARMLAIEHDVQHDVIAFLSMVAETAGDDARHLHVGLTSSDLVDTALACQIQAAGRVLARETARLRRAAWTLAQRHRKTPMVGRSHGVHAEPITFGLKCLSWSEELGRALDRLGSGLPGWGGGEVRGGGGARAARRAPAGGAGGGRGGRGAARRPPPGGRSRSRPRSSPAPGTRRSPARSPG